MGFDLHVHTTASDGRSTPEEVIRLATRLGLEGLAITDHDTVEGIAPALQYISRTGLDFELVPGIEFNTEVGASDVHILGYYLDYTDPHLLLGLEGLKQSREGRLAKIAARLEGLGLPIDYDQVKRLARGNVYGRPHIADAMIEKGYVRSREEAFDKYLDNNRPAYVPRYKFKPRRAIEMVHECGGLAVLAHPGLIADQGLVNQVMAMGIDGIEVHYPRHSELQTANYQALVEETGLFATGGSDFHGTEEEVDKLGIMTIDRQLLDLMKKRLPGG